MPGHGKVAVKLFGEKAAAMAREASATSGSASTDATSSVVGGTFGSFAPSSTRIRRSTIRPQEHAPLMAGEAATRQMVDLNRKLMLLLETERAARLVAEAEAKRSAAKSRAMAGGSREMGADSQCREVEDFGVRQDRRSSEGS